MARLANSAVRADAANCWMNQTGWGIGRILGPDSGAAALRREANATSGTRQRSSGRSGSQARNRRGRTAMAGQISLRALLGGAEYGDPPPPLFYKCSF